MSFRRGTAEGGKAPAVGRGKHKKENSKNKKRKHKTQKREQRKQNKGKKQHKTFLVAIRLGETPVHIPNTKVKT